MKARTEARRLARLGAIADVRVRIAQQALTSAGAAAQAARHRLSRIETLIASLPTHGQAGMLAAAASLRAVLHPAAQAASDAHGCRQRDHDTAQRIMLTASARASHLDGQTTAARHRAATEAEEQARMDQPPTREKK